MSPATPRCARLSVRMDQRGDELRFGYDTATEEGAVSVCYPFSLDEREANLLDAVGVGVATYLAQLCLAREVAIDFPARPELWDAISPIAEMLYDIRRWKDGADLVAPPDFRFTQPRSGEWAGRLAGDTDRSLLLFSGGKDSTLATFALRRNGYHVSAVHATANAGVETAEEHAVEVLGARLGLSVQRLRYRHPEFRALSGRYARNWDAFPHFNAVPFGRDLLLAVLTLPILTRQGIGVLSLGHDGDCRRATVTYRGKEIPRNDVESSAGAVALERYMSGFAIDGLELLPPLAALSELMILREMFERHPELMRETAFCFWGASCGRCAKCLRYFLAERLFGADGTLSFQANPLAGGACPELEDILGAWGRERILFDTEVVYMLGRLVERGDVRPGEDALGRFRDVVYPEVAPQLAKIEAQLHSVREDPQVPASFVAV